MIAFDSYFTSEQRLHSSLRKYLDLAYKGLFYFHVHNKGKRSPYKRYLAKEMGIRSRMPDLMIPKPSLGYHGLAVELKIKPNKLTLHQKEVLQKLEGYGWKIAVCYDFEEGKRRIDNYLRGDLNKEKTKSCSPLQGGCRCLNKRKEYACA